jgi:hypothetical protein
METDHLGPDSTEPSAPAREAGSPSAEESRSAPPDPAALVDRLIQAGEWPDPDLLEQIIAAGETALGPLLAFLRTYPSAKDYSREIILYNVIGILSKIHSPSTIPDVVEILKRYPDDSGEFAAEVLGDFGAVAFEPALELVRDPRMTGYLRQNAIEAARRAAGSDPALRARLADVLRPMLAEAMERIREEKRKSAQRAAEEGEESESGGVNDRDERDLDEENVEKSSEASAVTTAVQSPYVGEESPPDLYEEVMFRIIDLAALADPEARDLIKTAYAEDLVDAYWVDEETVEESYRKGGDEIEPPGDWLEVYQERYQDHLERRNRPPAPSGYLSTRERGSRVTEMVPTPFKPQEPIHKTGPKLGRNDPCWCGSGKKYKKCHLGKEGRS